MLSDECNEHESHPLRVSGLKYFMPSSLSYPYFVSPLAGEWIEIRIIGLLSRRQWSHPLRVSGLKYFYMFVWQICFGLTPCG